METTAEQRLRYDGGQAPTVEDMRLGADALALLRELPEWDQDGACIFTAETVCRAEDGRGLPHASICPRHRITALLTRAGRA
jgi:hypothetical protein